MRPEVVERRVRVCAPGGGTVRARVRMRVVRRPAPGGPRRGPQASLTALVMLRWGKGAM